MRRSRWAMLLATATGAALAGTAMLPAGLAAARPAAGARPAAAQAPQAGASGPTIKLIAMRHAITAQSAGKQVYVDPDVYVAALDSPLRFDIRRASYADPITVTQVISLPGGASAMRPLPRYTIDGWQGLRRFLRMTIVSATGKVVGSRILTFCPNSSNPQRVSPDSPPDPLFPQSCSGNDPFIKGMVWGLQQGWATDPLGSGVIPIPLAESSGQGQGSQGDQRGGQTGGTAGGSNLFRLRPGKYTVTMNVTLMWRKLLHVSQTDGTAKVRLTVKKGSGCPQVCPPQPATRRARALRPLPSVPLLAHPPQSALPDMVPLPSWGISLSNTKATTRHHARSVLTFGATIAIEGNSRLDVEGFRVHGSSLLQAYQYFWENGHVIGRAKAGTMGYESGWGTKEWHFQQFAQYRLLNAAKSVIVRSRKVGFCIAPTDAIDLTLRRATWVPNVNGPSGECGSAGALWVQEMLPLGWADTYFQSFGEQAFDISNLPNGTYYIEIIANPERLLHESDYGDDVSLRKVIISGTAGHRTVRVPAYHGIDPEH